MPESNETSRTRRNLRTGAAIGGVTMVVALAASPATAAKSHESVRHPQRTSVLEQRTEKRIKQHRPVEIYGGTLTVRARQQDPLTKQWNIVASNVDNPIVVFRGNPKAETPRDPVTSGDYDLGSVTDKMGHPVVDLMPYNPKTMTLTPGLQPGISEATLGGGQGSLEFNRAFDGQGNAIVDSAGNLAFIAYKYTPGK